MCISIINELNEWTRKVMRSQVECTQTQQNLRYFGDRRWLSRSDKNLSSKVNTISHNSIKTSSFMIQIYIYDSVNEKNITEICSYP